MGQQTCEVQSENTDSEVNWDEKPLLTRDHFHEEFSTEAYLKDFYTKVDDPAMQMVLTFLPGIAARLPDCESMLDFGAGPTIHASTCFRNRAKNIYLADYLPQNRDELQKWLDGRSTFDWTRVLRMIAAGEGIGWEKTKEMERKTKSKIKGIFFCNCLEDPVLTAPDELFGHVRSCGFDLHYRVLFDDNGRVSWLFYFGWYLGSELTSRLETWCSFGGRKFNCCYITRDFMLQCLQDAGLIIDLVNHQATVLFEVNGMFMIAAQKTRSDA
ncbi:hypothetical protein M3Y94_00135200 [Aphelenchoides besseyi]|nr:hypothetical protein M3Y94_00135200 [Aphelenchoides besseyi]